MAGIREPRHCQLLPFDKVHMIPWQPERVSDTGMRESETSNRNQYPEVAVI